MERERDWYLAEWMALRNRRQADIVRDLDWNKARVSLMLSGKQQYTRDAVNQLAAYLDIEPHELLMHPRDAIAIRRLRDGVARLVAEDAAEYRLPEPVASDGRLRPRGK